MAARTAELDKSRLRFAALVQHSSDVVTVIDRDGRILYQSESCQRVLGRSAESMTGGSVWDLMVDAEADLLKGAIAAASQELLRMQTLHNVWHRGDLSECHLEITVTNMLDDASVAGLVLNSRDVTDRTVLEEELLHQAFHDSLTTLSNRAMFKNRLEHALTRRDRKPGSLAVLFLDLDGFKEVNDTLGHSSGDQLLVQVAQRLRGQSRPGDTVARFGGDEFAVLIEDLNEPAYAIDLAQRMNSVLRAPYELGSTRVHITASVGIAYHGDHATDAEQLLRNADLAMYQAKAAQAGGYALYDPSMHAGLVQRIQLEADLRMLWSTTDWRRTTSPSSTCAPAASAGLKHWPVGNTRSWEASLRSTSSRSPSRPGSSARWENGSSARRAGRPCSGSGGALPWVISASASTSPLASCTTAT